MFEMAETGLLEVAGPGARLPRRSRRLRARAASSRPTLEGSRPLLVEVQALVSPTGYGTPSRKASGVDPNRLSLLIAVLGRRAGIGLGSHDVYANLAGGLSVAEPALDLPLALALASSTARPADPARDRSRSARSGCSASCGRSPGSNAGCARPPGSASSGPSSRGRRPARPSPSIDGLDVVAVATLRDAVEAALDRPAAPLVARRSPRC